MEKAVGGPRFRISEKSKYRTKYYAALCKGRRVATSLHTRKAAASTKPSNPHSNMAVTVLGKRNRASDSTSGELSNVQNATALTNITASLPVLPSSISSRVKRRNNVRVHVDGDAAPAFAQARLDALQQDVSTDLELLERNSPNDDRLSQRVSASATRTLGRRKLVRSPCKAKGQDRALEAYEGELLLRLKHGFNILTERADAENDENNVQLPTPKTPRHKDALSKRVPITPRHRIGFVGKPVTPRFTRTPSTPSNAPSVYNSARQLFTRSTDPGRLIGRRQEWEEVHDFLQQGIDCKTGRCLYVSGPPGTGKSALVGEVCKEIGGKDGVKVAYINCMSVESSGEVCQKLVDKLLGNESLENDDLEVLRALFLPERQANSPTFVVTLDEIDHLLKLDLEILYTLFEWSLQQSSRLIIVGIANALDLTDRFLPRLKARNLKPRLIPFLPYTADQIAAVITTKLRTLLTEAVKDQASFVPFVHPAAIQLCSKKVASQTGDLRKAFDIIRRTIDLVESELKQKVQSLENSPSKTPLADNPNLSSPSCPQSSSLTTFTSCTAPRATIAHVSRVSAAALSNGTSQRLATLNLQQKAALCALVSHQMASRKAMPSIFATPSKTAKPLPPTIRKLYETYCALCKRENALHPLTATEFADVLSGLESLGLVGEDKKGFTFGAKSGTSSRKGTGMASAVREDRRMVSFVDEKELHGCLDGVGGSILRGLLSGDV